jgi:hypothetical protein
LGRRGAEPSPRKACPWPFLPVSYFGPDFERRCWGGRTRTSSVPVVHRSTVCPPSVASSATSVGDLAVVKSRVSEELTLEAQEVSALVTLGANGPS